MKQKFNLLLVLLVSVVQMLSYSASGKASKDGYTDDLIKKVIAEDTIGIKNRESAIKFYEKKIGNLNLDKRGQLESFDCSLPRGLEDSDLKYLVFFPEIISIHLADKKLTDKIFYYFQNMKNLEAISLYDTSINGEGFKYLVDNVELDTFIFKNSSITDEGLKYLSEIKYKKPIIGLYLDNSKVTDAGMPYIAKMKFDQGRISLSGTAVTDEGIKHLAGFKNMIEIFLYNTKVTDKGGKWLETQLPDTTVYWGKHVPKDDEED